MRNQIIRIGGGIVAAVLALTTVAAAQHGGSSHSPAPEFYPPPSISGRPIRLITGVGGVNDVVTTTSAEAQAYHNQGMAYLHLFAYLQAARSFNEAIRRDSSLAMSYAFLSSAYSSLGDTESADSAIRWAVRHAPRASRREQVRIQVMAAQRGLSEHGSRDSRAALDSALAEFPEDPELWIMRGKIAPGGSGKDMTQVAYYEVAIARNPDHPAPHHYLVHVYESLGRIDLAVRHGEILARLAPNVAHARHMYGHDLRRVGRVAEAIAEFEAARKIEVDIYLTDSISSKYDWHHPHNLHLLSLAYLHQGRVAEAERLLRLKASLPTLQPHQELYNSEPLLSYLIRQGRHQEVQVLADSFVTRPRPLLGAGFLYRGHLLLAAGKVREADSALGTAVDSGSTGEQVTLLRGTIMLQSGMVSEGTKVLTQLITEMRSQEGPDPWINTLFNIEAIATAAQTSNAWELAEHAAKELLQHDSAYGGSHVAMARVAEHNGDRAAAREWYQRAKRCWENADPDFPALRAIADRLAALTSTGPEPSGGRK